MCLYKQTSIQRYIYADMPTDRSTKTYLYIHTETNMLIHKGFHRHAYAHTHILQIDTGILIHPMLTLMHSDSHTYTNMLRQTLRHTHSYTPTHTFTYSRCSYIHNKLTGSDAHTHSYTQAGSYTKTF